MELKFLLAAGILAAIIVNIVVIEQWAKDQRENKDSKKGKGR